MPKKHDEEENVDDLDAEELEATDEDAPEGDETDAQVKEGRVGPVGAFDLSKTAEEREAEAAGIAEPLTNAPAVTITIEDLGSLLGDSAEDLQAELEVLVREAIAELLDDTSVDLENYLPGIAAAMIEAVKTGDDALVKELTAQLKAVGEISRLKANKELRELFEVASGKIIEVATASARIALQTALGALNTYEIRTIR